MKEKCIYLLFTLLAANGAIFFACAQTEKIPVAVVDFVAAKGVRAKNEIISQLYETVSSEMTNRQKFRVLDRSVFNAILKEENLQVTPDFLNSPKLIQTGAKTGARFLATGNLVGFTETSVRGTGTDNTITHTVKISFALKIINLQTGETFFSDVIDCSHDSFKNTEEALQEDMSEATCRISTDISKCFAPKIHIIGVNKVDRKGLPDEVEIDAGDSIFINAQADGGKCGRSGFFFKSGGLFLSVIEVLTTKTFDGREIKRNVPIGKVRLQKVEGNNASACVVTDGNKEIGKQLNDKAILLVAFD